MPRFLMMCVLIFVGLLTACAAPPPAATPGAVATPQPAASVVATEESLFPLTITDAAGQKFTYDALLTQRK